MDADQLRKDIREATSEDPHCSKIISSLNSNDNSPWTYESDGLLRRNGVIWVPNAKDLYLHILRDKHDHVLAGHFGLHKTLSIIRRQYAWPNM